MILVVHFLEFLCTHTYWNGLVCTPINGTSAFEGGTHVLQGRASVRFFFLALHADPTNSLDFSAIFILYKTQNTGTYS